jgi:hypothetical protein
VTDGAAGAKPRNDNVATAPPAQSREKAATAERKRPKAEVYTNDDLERLFGPAPAEVPSAAEAAAVTPIATPPATATSATTQDPLAQMEEARRATTERQQQIEEGERALTTAKERVTALEKRVLAVKNPFMARPTTPEENTEEWAGMNNVQRLSRSEEELNQARQQLEEAEAKLRQLRSGN